MNTVTPQGPKISLAIRHLMAASALQSISPEVKDAGISQAVHSAGKTLFDAAVRYMNYDNDAWYFASDLRPLPSQGQPYYGALLLRLSNAISMEHLKGILHTAGESLIKTSSIIQNLQL